MTGRNVSVSVSKVFVSQWECNACFVLLNSGLKCNVMKKILIPRTDMSKKKNHTNHNQNRKDHRNGIKKARMPRFCEFEGLHPSTVERMEEAARLWNSAAFKK